MDHEVAISPNESNSEANSIRKEGRITVQTRGSSSTTANPSPVGSSNPPSIPEIPAVYQNLRNIEEQVPLQKENEKTFKPPPPHGPPGPHAGIEMTLAHEIFFVGSVALAHAMIQFCINMVLAPIDIIAATFHTRNPGENSWFISGYALTVGTFILISGRAGDILGHKRVFIAGYVWLGVWSAFGGFAAYPQKQIFFDFCRVMQGIGSAMLMPNALALLGRSYGPGLRKNIIFSIFGACAPIGSVLGSIFGSIFAELAWWPWVFWTYALICFPLGTFAFFITPKPLSQLPPKRPSFDWSGSVLGVAALTLINIAFNNGPLYGWDKPYVFVLLIIGVVILVAFGWVEMHALNPIFPKAALNSTVGYILACLILGWGSFGVWVYYTFRFLEVVRHQRPLLVAAEFVPVVVAAAIASFATGFMLSHTPVSFVMFLAMVGFFLGITLVGTMPADQTYWGQAFFGILIMPIGMDMSFPASTVILSNHMPGEHQGLAAALVTTVMNYSVSITLGIAALVEVQTLPKNPSPSDVEHGMHSAYYVGIAFGAAAVILAALFFVRTFMKEGWKVMAH